MGKFLNRLKLPLFSTNPSSPVEGEIWYDSVLKQVKYKSGSPYHITVHSGTRFNDYATGRWYPMQVGAPNTGNANPSRAFTNPFVIPRLATLSGISLEVSTAWTTAGNVRVGLYDDDGGRMPTNLIADYGTQVATASVKTFSMTQVLNPGVYWVVAVNQGGTGGTTGQFRGVTGIQDFLGDSAATPTFFNGSFNCYYSDTGFTGALPSSFGAVAGIGLGPRFAIKFST